MILQPPIEVDSELGEKIVVAILFLFDADTCTAVPRLELWRRAVV